MGDLSIGEDSQLEHLPTGVKKLRRTAVTTVFLHRTITPARKLPKRRQEESPKTDSDHLYHDHTYGIIDRGSAAKKAKELTASDIGNLLAHTSTRD